MKAKTPFFDSRAQDWEKTCYPREVRARLRDLIQKFGVAPGERVLDVGTGPGILIPYLRALVGGAGQVCALDLSLEMVRRACAKPRGPMDMIVRADVHSIPFTHNLFDRVICFAAFPHFDHPRQALREMSRVLRPGGVLIVAHLMSREELSRHHALHASVARDALPTHSRMRTLFREAGLSLPEIMDMPGRYLAKGVKTDR